MTAGLLNMDRMSMYVTILSLKDCHFQPLWS